ncbi:MAG: hypothetical protein M3065_02775 [Actinomycetota bacterium]|nr:hypothetical protein [Actinomycetota bacterium]
MPDNDLVPTRVARHWRRPFRAALEGVNAAEVGDEIRAATAAALRDAEGCPGIAELARAARDTARSGDLGGWDGATREFLDRNGRSLLAQTMLREAEGLLGSDREGLAIMGDRDVSRDVATGGLRRLVDERMWARGREVLLERYETFDDTRRFEVAANEQASLPELAERLLTRPDAAGLRAPDRRLRPRPTSSLLHEELD